MRNVVTDARDYNYKYFRCEEKVCYINERAFLAQAEEDFKAPPSPLCRISLWYVACLFSHRPLNHALVLANYQYFQKLLSYLSSFLNQSVFRYCQCQVKYR